MKIRITSCPTAANGLQVEDNKATPISDNMVMLGGDSHADGGTKISYNGHNVEAEKGEPFSVGNEGQGIVWGGMKDPKSGKKFKVVAKELGEKQAEYTKIGDKATNLLATSAPDNKYERLAWNSGRVMQIGALYGQKDVNQKLESLGHMQNALLETAHENGYDPEDLSNKLGTDKKIKKAKKGAFLPYAAMGFNGEDPKKKKPAVIADDWVGNDPTDIGNLANLPNDPTVADRHNNPGNIKFDPNTKYGKLLQNKYGAVQGEVSPDGGYFAKFPDVQSGATAAKNLLFTGDKYKNMTLKDALGRWTNGKPYDLTGLGDLLGKKVSSIPEDQRDNVMNYMQQGEGTKYGSANPGVFAKNSPLPGGGNPYTPTPYTYTEQGLPQTDPLTPDAVAPTPDRPTPPSLGEVNPPQNTPIPSNAQGLDLKQILPEIYGFATNKEVPVALQKYTPQMYVPYQVSFQDQLNDNQASQNAILRQLPGNPALAAGVGAQKYSADNRVRAEEFRTNQGIANDITNKNIAINNDAQLKNLQLADTQYTRQSEAKSRTKEINQAILNSINSKFLQNNLQNKTLQAYENTYDYRFDPNGKADYYGPNAQLNYTGTGGYQNTDPNARVVRDGKGNIIRTITQPNQVVQGQELLNQERQRKLDQLNRKWYKGIF